MASKTKTKNIHTTFIYALIDPETKLIRYIGKSNNPKGRWYEHHQPCRLKGQTHKNNWIKSLLKKDLRAEMIILEECDESNWQERECYFISKYKNDPTCKLTNTMKGGAGQFRRIYVPEMTDEIKKKIGLKIKKLHKEGHFLESYEKLSKNMQGNPKEGSFSSKYIGVIMTPSNNWSASIRHRSSCIHLGRFKTEKEAAIAYDCKARELYGPHAKTNFKEILPCPINTTQSQHSKYKGITLANKTWQATVFVNGKKIYLGSFPTEQEAYEARCLFLSSK